MTSPEPESDVEWSYGGTAKLAGILGGPTFHQLCATLGYSLLIWVAFKVDTLQAFPAAPRHATLWPWGFGVLCCCFSVLGFGAEAGLRRNLSDVRENCEEPREVRVEKDLLYCKYSVEQPASSECRSRARRTKNMFGGLENINLQYPHMQPGCPVRFIQLLHTM